MITGFFIMANLNDSSNSFDIVDGELELKDEVSGSDSDTSVQILDEQQNDQIQRNESGEYESFVVDIRPEKNVKNEATNQSNERASSPVFAHSDVISHHTPVLKENTGSSGRRSGRQSCFNCGSFDHALVQCSKPHDRRQISQNRNSFRRSRESGGGRFHDEQPQGPKPGVISDTLRAALSIGPRELPPWIYRMRKKGFIDGYPPAYRKRAAETSTVKFHTDEEMIGTRKRKHIETEREQKYRLQPEKMIRYPGFNYYQRDLIDRDICTWEIPPWDIFVAAQQAFIDQRVPQVEEEEKSPPNKRAKKVGNGGTREEHQDKDSAQYNEVSEEEYDEDDDENVLFVDARSSLDITREEGEITEDEDVDLNKNVTFRRKRTVKKKSECVVIMRPTSSCENTATPISSTAEHSSIKNVTPVGDKSIGLKAEFGTPVPLNTHVCGDKHDHEIKKPELDKWSEGIQAFQHQAPSTSSGFFNKMHKLIRKLRDHKKPPPQETQENNNDGEEEDESSRVI